MKALVTGGAGFIGSHLSAACVKAGHSVTVVDDLSSGHRANVPEGVRFEELDVRSTATATLVEEVKPDVIFHYAAQMNVRCSVEDPLFDASVNITGTINLLEAAHKAGTRKVVFASSGGTVYGNPESFPCREDVTPTHPVSPYGVSKLSGEHYLHYYHVTYSMDYVAFRYANIYGPRQDPHGEAGVVAIFAQALLEGRDCTIFGDGLQTRDYVFVDDVVSANMDCLGKDFCGALNIGTGRETNVVDLFAAIKKHAGGSGKAVHAEAKEGEARRNCLDASRANYELGWLPATSLDQGLAATVDFFRSRS
ncbi:MAG: NAD-dependent epimerase/dehydratase family protein [Deltaproteobacteria bacterium]